MKKYSKIIIYLLAGLFSFIFFLYLSFPYNILKETIASQMSSALGISVSIKDLGPRMFIGLKAEGVKLADKTAKEIEFKTISAKVSLLSLLLANLSVNLSLEDSSGGNADIDVGFGLLGLIGGNYVPSSFSMQSQKFVVGNLAELGLKMQASNPGTSPFIKPILEKIEISSKLNSSIDFSINTSDFSQSSGELNISFVDTIVTFDPGMQIPSQKFTSAVIKASSKGGSLTFDPSSKFKTDDIDIALVGKVIEKSKIEQSVLDMEIRIELFKELKNTFGVILNAVAGKEIEGKLSVKISGPLIPGPEIKIL